MCLELTYFSPHSQQPASHTSKPPHPVLRLNYCNSLLNSTSFPQAAIYLESDLTPLLSTTSSMAFLSALSIKTQVFVVANQAPLICLIICLLSLLPSHLRPHPSGLSSSTTLSHHPHFGPGPIYLICSLMKPCSLSSIHI